MSYFRIDGIDFRIHDHTGSPVEHDSMENGVVLIRSLVTGNVLAVIGLVHPARLHLASRCKDSLDKIGFVSGQMPDQTAGLHTCTLRIAERNRTEGSVRCHYIQILVKACIRLLKVFGCSFFIAGFLSISRHHGCNNGTRAVGTLIGTEIRIFPRQPAVLVKHVTWPDVLIPESLGSVEICLVAGSIIHLEKSYGYPAGIISKIISEACRTAVSGISFIIVTFLLIPFLEIILYRGSLFRI